MASPLATENLQAAKFSKRICSFLVILPLQDRITCKLGPVVRDGHAGVASHLSNPVLSSRATRMPDSDVSTTAAKYSRLKSSITFRMWNRRPHDRLSDTKSRLQRWLASGEWPSGFLCPRYASCRHVCAQSDPPLCRCDTAFSNLQTNLRAAVEYAGVGVRTAVAPTTSPSVVPASQYLPIGLPAVETYED